MNNEKETLEKEEFEKIVGEKKRGLIHKIFSLCYNINIIIKPRFRKRIKGGVYAIYRNILNKPGN